MDVLKSFRRLTLWKQLAVLGSLASIVGTAFASPTIWGSFVQFLHEREMARHESDFLAKINALLDAGRIADAKASFANIPEAELRSEEANSLNAVVEGLNCYCVPSENCAAVLQSKLRTFRDHPLSTIVDSLLAYRSRLATGERSPAEGFRQWLEVNPPSHHLIRLLIAQEVGVSDPEWARSLLNSILEDTVSPDRCLLVAKAYYLLAKTEQACSNWNLAKCQFEKSLTWATNCEFSENDLRADILCGLANAYSNLGDTLESNLQINLLVALARGDSSVALMASFCQAVQKWKNRQYVEAMVAMGRVAQMCKNTNDRKVATYRCVYARTFMAMCEIDRGMFGESVEGELLYSITEFARMGHGPFDEEEAWAHLLLALFYQHAGNLAAAHAQFDRASSIRKTRITSGDHVFWPEERWLQAQKELGANVGQ